VKRCATCKHWNTYASETVVQLGVCDAVRMYWESTKWNAEGNRREYAVPDSVTAFVQDASDYSATLYTKPEHGCTMHEAKG
jgi:hypothetical protein